MELLSGYGITHHYGVQYQEVINVPKYKYFIFSPGSNIKK